jgi:hypothetical protein
VPVIVESALSQCTTALLRNPDKTAEWITVADRHMQTYVVSPETFILPKAHEFLKPLIESYALNIDGFTLYLVELRDSFDRRSSQYTQIQAVYRRVNGRYVQQLRRERMGRAVAQAEKLYGEIPYQERIQWIAKLEHEWAQRRIAFLEQQRRRVGEPCLPVEIRTELLLEFWGTIDTEIYEGQIPPWNLKTHGVTPH